MGIKQDGKVLGRFDTGQQAVASMACTYLEWYSELSRHRRRFPRVRIRTNRWTPEELNHFLAERQRSVSFGLDDFSHRVGG